MARLNPDESFATLKDRVTETVKSNFPMQGRVHTLHLDKVGFGEDRHIDDVGSQYDKKMAGQTWGIPLVGTFRLVNNKTGLTVDTHTRKILDLPKVTRRYSYIVKGKEYQIDNQWRLKNGVYARVRDNGELESRFNLVNLNRRGFFLDFKPESRKFTMRVGAANIALYPVMREVLGVGDGDLTKSWGKNVLAANQDRVNAEREISKLHKAVFGPRLDAASHAEAVGHLRDAFGQTVLDPATTQLTLGKKLSTVDGNAMSLASSKLLGVARGTHKPDNREALMFKGLHSAEDFIAERLGEGAREIKRKVSHTLDRKEKVNEIVNLDLFNRHVHDFFVNNDLANTPEQVNPLEMISGQMKTTLMGRHGIGTESAVLADAKLVDPSHLGFQDPIQTPEGSRTGITLQLALGARKDPKSNDVHVKVYDRKLRKQVEVTPRDLMGATVVMPDQVDWKGNHPVARSARVKAMRDGDIADHTFSDARYVMRSSMEMFGTSSNLVPFLPTVSGNRSMFAGRHMEQAIPLVHREAPLVQVAMGEGDAPSVEDWVGSFSAHRAPVGGTVHQVRQDKIIIKTTSGKRHDVHLYDNFPLNGGKNHMHSTPAVKAGDKVKKGQHLADTNFTKGGTLAIGTNLRVAYIPYRGYNFEDGVVISESASKKLTSSHLHQHDLVNELDWAPREDKFKRRWIAHNAASITPDQAKKMDDGGVVHEGMIVHKGDPLILAMKKNEAKGDLAAYKRQHKMLFKPFQDKSLLWDQDVSGKVVKVHRHGKTIKVHVETAEPLEVGDKLSGRVGNKGIVVLIKPDHEMPKTEAGLHAEVLLNPTGVGGRMNLGQILETAASKIARKTGKPYRTLNFAPGMDYLEKVRADLKTHGLTDKEVLFDGATDKKIGPILFGEQYIIKQKHQATKKLQVRSRGNYDVNLAPQGGGPTSGQALDTLGLYALLAHGARHNIAEFQTLKSEYNPEVWARVHAGEPLPPPKIPFAFKKFESYLASLGVNVHKDGHTLTLLPYTDKQVLDMVRRSGGGEVVGDTVVIGKNLRPEKGGIFDVKATGGMHDPVDVGRRGPGKWSYIKLDSPIPNPIFEGAITKLTGLTGKQFDDVMRGQVGVSADRKLVDPHTDGAMAGGRGIRHLLRGIDVKRDLKEAQARLAVTRGPQRLNQLNVQVKYLRALDRAGQDPTVYMQNYVPLMPPAMRPLSVMDDGRLNLRDVNGIYRAVGIMNKHLKEIHPGLPEEHRHELEHNVYDGLKALAGTGGNVSKYLLKGAPPKGVLELLHGETPKTGFIQSKMLKRRQDLSMRAIIIPEPAMDLDQIGLPREAAMELYKPFVIGELRKRHGMQPLAAEADHVEKRTSLAYQALESVVKDRPLLLKRDPALHKYSVQAFRPLLVSGKAIKIHPLVTSGYNADFDGDTMSAFVPLTPKAVKEARKMFPSHNLFHPASGEAMYFPTLESQLGLYMLTKMGKKTAHKFANDGELARAVKDKKVGVTDIVSVNGKNTTMGRLMIHNELPPSVKTPEMLTDPKWILDKGGSRGLFADLGKKAPHKFGHVANRLKDMANEHAYWSGFTMGLEDLSSLHHVRDPVLHKADAEVKRIRGLSIPQADRDQRVVTEYKKAADEIMIGARAHAAKNPTSASIMMESGIKPGPSQYQQIVVGASMIQDAVGRTLPTRIRSSYSEGQDTGEYWLQSQGARRGAIMKTVEVQKPGALTKQIMNATMDSLVMSQDCGAERGHVMDVGDRDALNRFTSDDHTVGGQKVKAGTLVTPNVLSLFRTGRVNRIKVRTPLECLEPKGLCGTCHGLDETGHLPHLGANVGVIAGQALGERSVQLAMREFHTGGAVDRGATVTGDFGRVEQLLAMPQKLRGSAVLATKKGKITKIQKNIAVGGHDVFIGDEQHYVPEGRGKPMYQGSPLRVGHEVKKGEPITHGPINPHELLPLSGIQRVRGHLVDELHDIYGKQGIRRNQVEMVVRAMTNLSHVQDPGDHPTLLRGDYVPTSVAAHTNRTQLKDKNPVRITPVLKGVNTLPLDMQEDWMARLSYRRLKETLIEGARQGWTSHIHGPHPVPGLLYGARFGKGTPSKPHLY